MVLKGIKIFNYFINRNDIYKMVVTYQRHHSLEQFDRQVNQHLHLVSILIPLDYHQYVLLLLLRRRHFRS